jgi:cation diffusion facilitator CzcD-associated flavoprotein CzcO
MMGATADHREVVVVGGGQAALAIGYFLKQQGRDFTILEAASAPAAAWRERWDSLKLFTPVRYDSLPGLAFPGDPDSYPGRDDVIAYLTDYARTPSCRLSSTAPCGPSGASTKATWSSSTTAPSLPSRW